MCLSPTVTSWSMVLVRAVPVSSNYIILSERIPANDEDLILVTARCGKFLAFLPLPDDD